LQILPILILKTHPAEAEEGFKRSCLHGVVTQLMKSFNPAEAEEGFRSEKDVKGIKNTRGFQFSQSRRRV
jgi:hypothetical protein